MSLGLAGASGEAEVSGYCEVGVGVGVGVDLLLSAVGCVYARYCLFDPAVYLACMPRGLDFGADRLQPLAGFGVMIAGLDLRGSRCRRAVRFGSTRMRA